MRDTLDKALDEYGTREIVGEEHNPEVLKYFQEIGHKWVKNDELAWCSAFVNWCCKKTGREFTGKLNARSWLDIGKKMTEPKRGDVVVLWRKKKDGPYGHVGFYIRETKTMIYILGGNQKNEVNITPYPKNRLLGYRLIEYENK